jgi:hypothetical protein
MNPSPEQVSEWRKEAESAWSLDSFAQIREGSYSAYIKGYIRARTEQATEIAALKAQIAELIPLAKFGAIVTSSRILIFQLSSVTSHALKAGVLMQDIEGDMLYLKYAPNIEATIEKLLKD